MNIIIKPIAYVHNNRKEAIDDDWGSVISSIELIDGLSESSFDGIEQFSHIEIVYYFHQSTKVVAGSEYPRENKKLPKVGIFAQRKKDRLNHIGVTIVKLIKKEGKSLVVTRLDAIDGTPVIDIKPVMKEFLPDETIKQPDWATDLMKNYWGNAI